MVLDVGGWMVDGVSWIAHITFRSVQLYGHQKKTKVTDGEAGEIGAIARMFMKNN